MDQIQKGLMNFKTLVLVFLSFPWIIPTENQPCALGIFSRYSWSPKTHDFWVFYLENLSRLNSFAIAFFVDLNNEQ